MKLLIFFCICIKAYTLESKQTDENEPKIIVIGAGIAGLAAADRLINTYGFEDVTILEGSDRIGGRIHPVSFGGTYLQLGAEYIHDKQNPIFQMALDLGLVPNHDVISEDFIHDLRIIDQNSCDIPANLRNDTLELVTFKFYEALENGLLGYNVTSCGHLMDVLYQELLINGSGIYNETEIHILDAVMRGQRSALEQYYSSIDWYNVSLREYIQFDQLYPNHTGDQLAIRMQKFGYKHILDEMIKLVPLDKHIQFKSYVKRIQWNNTNSSVMIELSDGRLLDSDHVIITSSLGHLKRYSSSLFNPTLPRRKLDLIHALGYDTVDKLWVIFDQPFWPNDTNVVLMIRINETYGLPQCDGSPKLIETNLSKMLEVIYASETHPNALKILIKGSDAPQFETDFTDQQIATTARDVLRKYFGNPSISMPKILRSSWHKDPLFHGSYSYNTIECEKIECLRGDLAEPLYHQILDSKVPAIQFAGEATMEYHHSTVHGAFMSGYREADRLGELYKNQ